MSTADNISLVSKVRSRLALCGIKQEAVCFVSRSVYWSATMLQQPKTSLPRGPRKFGWR